MRLHTLPALCLLLSAAPASAQNCGAPTTGFTPLSDLAGSGTYQGEEGGLYPGGQNSRPAAHEIAGLAEAALVVPRNAAGMPDPAGAIGCMSIGLSNTTMEFSRFIPLADADPAKNPRVVLIDAAQGGQAAEDVADPAAPYWSFVAQRVAQAGLSPAQMQVVWLKTANRMPTGPFVPQAAALQGQMRTIVQILRANYPNLRLCYVSSRIYAGYATTNLNPEPWAYESGFAVKWLLRDQINGDPGLAWLPAGTNPPQAPWLSWGPYMWADGTNPRSDGRIWVCADFEPDGTHPSDQGRDAVAGMLLDFFKTDSTSVPWFLGTGSSLLLDHFDLVRGQPTRFRVRNALPGETVSFLYSLQGTGAGPCPAKLGGLCLDLLPPIVLFGQATANGQGTALLDVTVPARAPLVMVHTQAVARRGPGGADSTKSDPDSAPILP